MKAQSIVLALTLLIASCASTEKAKEAAKEQVHDITVYTKKIGDKTHWEPEKIEVYPGEKVRITAKHELKGGYDFHSLRIPELNIDEKVNRNQPVTIERTVPETLKPGKYKISCAYHPTHVPATLVVVPAPH